jgi:uncharacterized protein (DUF849 family)
MTTILTCAVTGNITTRNDHPALPATPQEIVKACIDAAEAGAAVVHIHVRDPVTALPSTDLELYRQVAEGVRAGAPDLILNLTTGPGGRFVPGADDPKVAGPGSTLTLPERRIEHVVALRPEICSLDFNTMNSGGSVVINTPRSLRRMAKEIVAAGVKPELECFDSGDIHLANDMIEDGLIPSSPFFQLVLGVKYGASATPETLMYLKELLPPGAVWSAFGIGRFEYPVLAQTFLLGGHIRVGLEDNVYLEKGVLAPDNAALVRKAARIVHDLGGSIATPREAREILGLDLNRLG